MKLVLATSNKDKVREIKEILDKNIEIYTIEDFDLKNFEVEEDGKTLKENAYKKAKSLYDILKIPTLADDTGLFVEALDLKPGVYSHRYAGDNPTYKDNRDKLLYELKNSKNRKAYFKTSVCFIDEKGKDYYFDGKIDGEISKKEYGNKDFGYDQIFEIVELNKTFGQMSDEEKNLYSHRSLALEKFKKFILKEDFNEDISNK